MKTISSSIRSQFNKHPELWFFVFANVVFTVMYIWSLFTNPALLRTGYFILFTVLTLIHIAIHWMLLIIGDDEKWFWPYVIIQGILALAITYLSLNLGMIFALFMALIGEVVGSAQRKTWVFLAVIYYIILSLISYIFLNGLETSGWWIIGTIPMTVFVIMYVSLYTRESRAREHTQNLLEELEVAHAQLAEYAAQVEELTLTTERQRMARELHDTLAQGLAGLILQLEAADSHISSQNPAKAQTIIQQAMTRARTTLADARRAIGDLRDNQNTPTDLNAAIQEEVDRFRHSTGITCTLKLCRLPTLSPSLAENVLRAISEGLVNVARHAEASEATLEMSCDQMNLLIEIRDNGKGFDPQEVVGRSGHYGLLGLRERARQLGGLLTIESTPNEGTIVALRLPLGETP